MANVLALLTFTLFVFDLFIFFRRAEEEWEKELEAELQDYEVVSEHKSSSSKNDNWEQDMDDILDDEEDLK